MPEVPLSRLLRGAMPGLLCAALMLWAGALQAAPAAPAAADPALEQRVTLLAQELRCLVCQNQTIADSQAPLALELKNQVREKLAQGVSDQDIIAFMVQRYGDFVLYRPPVKSTTWLLWFGPFALLVLGLGVLIFNLRGRRSPSAPLPAADIARASALLTQNPDVKALP